MWITSRLGKAPQCRPLNLTHKYHTAITGRFLRLPFTNQECLHDAWRLTTGGPSSRSTSGRHPFQMSPSRRLVTQSVSGRRRHLSNQPKYRWPSSKAPFQHKLDYLKQIVLPKYQYFQKEQLQKLQQQQLQQLQPHPSNMEPLDPLDPDMVDFINQRAIPTLTIRGESNHAQQLALYLLQYDQQIQPPPPPQYPQYPTTRQYITANAITSLFLGLARDKISSLDDMWTLFQQLTQRWDTQLQQYTERYTPQEQVAMTTAFLHACASFTSPGSSGATSHTNHVGEINSKEQDARQAILQHVNQLYEQHTEHLTTLLFNNMIHFCANDAQDHYGAASQAEDWLLKLSQLAAQKHQHCRPNAQSFNNVIKAWAYSTDEPKGAERCREILDLMMRLGEAHQDVRPNQWTFRACLLAHVHRGLVMEAEEVLQQAVKYYQSHSSKNVAAREGLTGTLNATLTAWVKHPEKDPNVILQRIEGLVLQYTDTIPPDSITNSIILKAHLRVDIASAIRRLEQGLTPLNDVCFGMMYTALYHSTDKRVPDWSIKVLKSNFEQHTSRVNPKSVVFCLVRHEDNVDVCWDVFRLTTKYGVVNANIYHRMINVLCRQGGTMEAATELLPKMESMESPQNLGEKGLHTLVMSSLGKEMTKEASQQAIDLLDRMKRLEIPCNSRLYTSAIKASALLPDLNDQWYVDSFNDMERLHNDRKHPFLWDTVTLKVFLKVLLQRRGSKQKKTVFLRAVQVLLDLCGSQTSLNPKPDSRMINLIVHGMLDQGVSMDTIDKVVVKIGTLHERGLLQSMPSPSTMKRMEEERARRVKHTSDTVIAERTTA